MEHYDLDKIKRNVRSKIVLSNMDAESNATSSQISRRVVFALAATLLLGCGLVTANAVTDGAVVEAVRSLVVKIDGKATDAKPEKSEWDGFDRYRYQKDNTQIIMDVNTDTVDPGDVEVDIDSKTGETNITIGGKTPEESGFVVLEVDEVTDPVTGEIGKGYYVMDNPSEK